MDYLLIRNTLAGITNANIATLLKEKFKVSWSFQNYTADNNIPVSKKYNNRISNLSVNITSVENLIVIKVNRFTL